MDKETILQAQTDPVFFVNELCYTFDPRTNKKDLRFRLYPYQEQMVRDVAYAIEHKQDLFVEKSRDMGVSWILACVILWFWLFKPNFHALLGSRKEYYVDNGTIQSLFGKIDYLLHWLPIKPEDFDIKKHRTYMKLTSPKTKSTIQGESANSNFSRAGRYTVIFYDELAFWQNQEASWEAGADSSPCRIAVTTPSAEPSYARAIRNSGLIKVKTLHWRLHPLKTDDWYNKEKKRRPAEAVARELDINWEGSLEGIVFPEHQYIRWVQGQYDPNKSLYVSWDFGLDGTAIGWWQSDPLTGRWRRIDSFLRNNRPIHFFLPLFGEPIDSTLRYTQEELDFIDKVKDYKRAIHYGDPDVSKRSFQSATMTTTREVLQSAGIYVQTDTKANNLEDRITATKMLLQQPIEAVDNPNNKYWYECVKTYRYPKRQENSQATSANLLPIHDFTSHHATETQYFAVNAKLEIPSTLVGEY